MVSHTVKMSGRSMFTEGIKLGYNSEKESKVSNAKKKELMGSNNR
jgi:hypothetical protein